MSFAATSLVGLILDISIYIYLINSGTKVFLASVIGSLAAVTFVFFAAGIYIFKSKNLGTIYYFVWLSAQALSITLFALVVQILTDYNVSPIVSKLSVIPITFLLNFLIMTIITKTSKFKQ